LKHNLDNITSQKWGARHVGEPHDHKSGGLEPLGPIGVYAYALRSVECSELSSAGSGCVLVGSCPTLYQIVERTVDQISELNFHSIDGDTKTGLLL